MFPGMGGRGMDPKRMAQMMRQMGIQMQEIPDVEEVVIRTKTKEIVFTDAEVQRITAQGGTTWQLAGTPKERPRTQGAGAGASAKPAAPGPSEPAPPAPTYTDADIKLVMEQAKVDRKAAIAALEEAGGEPAEAIVKLLEEDTDST